MRSPGTLGSDRAKPHTAAQSGPAEFLINNCPEDQTGWAEDSNTTSWTLSLLTQEWGCVKGHPCPQPVTRMAGRGAPSPGVYRDGAPSVGFGLKCKMHKLVHHRGTEKGLPLAGRRLGGQGQCPVGRSDSQSPASL